MNSAIIQKVQGFLSKVSKEGVKLDPKLVARKMEINDNVKEEEPDLPF